MLLRTRLMQAGVAATCIFLSSCLAAQAATVSIDTVSGPPLWTQIRTAPRTNPPDPGSLPIGIVFRGGKEESNAVTVELGADHVVFSDSRAPVSAGNGCEQVGVQVVRCGYSHPQVPSNYPPDAPRQVPGGIQVTTGGGPASSVRITGTRPAAASDATVLVDGSASGTTMTDDSTGPGTTYMVGGAGPDALRAGSATTFIDGGGGGPDELIGGAGKTMITDGDAGHPDADAITGGSGVTTLVYRDRTASITVDLAREAGQGAVGENDTIRQIHRVIADDLAYYDRKGRLR